MKNRHSDENQPKEKKMTQFSKLLMVLAGCCLVLTVALPLQTGSAAPRTVLMELFDATW
jgi:hypothetical protein